MWVDFMGADSMRHVYDQQLNKDPTSQHLERQITEALNHEARKRSKGVLGALRAWALMPETPTSLIIRDRAIF